jgi:hypothetical protein
METRHVVIGGVLVAGLGYLYLKRTKGSILPSKVVNVFTPKSGYNSMMKIGPEYYNSTSMEGAAFNTQSYGDSGVPIDWTLGAEQGNAMLDNPGWTSFPDTYSAKVSASWLEQAQGVHL